MNGLSSAVDIQSYSLWREAIAALPLVPVAATLLVARPLMGEISFEVETNWTYVIHQAFNPCAWQEIQRLKFQKPGVMTFPVRFTEPQGYWHITRFPTPEP